MKCAVCGVPEFCVPCAVCSFKCAVLSVQCELCSAPYFGLIWLPDTCQSVRPPDLSQDGANFGGLAHPTVGRKGVGGSYRSSAILRIVLLTPSLANWSKPLTAKYSGCR